MKVVVVSGGFDPLHSGHIDYLEGAKQLGDKLIVALNSDEWLTRKKGRPFMPFEERARILETMDMVDNVWGFDDKDGPAVVVWKMPRRHMNMQKLSFATEVIEQKITFQK